MSKTYSSPASDSEPERRSTEAPQTPEPRKDLPLHEVLEKGSDEQICQRAGRELQALVSAAGPALNGYCILSVYEPEDSIDSWDANRIFTALQAENPKRDRDVLLVMASSGGQIEPAYQISKICKAFAKEKFVIAVPRAAKSAATLIALGADQIHMGMMGELGPIDPQLGDLPALGVKRALETIAGVCEKHPGSAEAFARYMSRMVSIAQIGYCERVAESATQYAERLLSKKESVRPNAAKIAKELVYEYMDHSFVIDLEEARVHLGEHWIVSDSPEIDFAEKTYQKLDIVNLLLKMFRSKKRLAVVGSLTAGAVVWEKS